MQLLLHLLLEELHCIGLGFLGNLDIGLHGLVVGVAGPFHDNLGRDAAGEGEADEGAASCVGANQVALGGSLLHTFTTFVYAFYGCTALQEIDGLTGMGTSKKITFGARNKAKLSAAQLALVTDKGWELG